MNIALFSDIHANLPALKAVLSDIQKRRIDVVYCLGDLVGYNIWPNEVIEEIRSRNIPVIAGNYDFGIGRCSDDCLCAYKSDQEKKNGQISIALTNEWISEENRQYLKTLPAHLRIEFQFDQEIFSILLVHGSPRKINEYLFEDRPEKSFLRILENSNADILCFGHTHKPFHRIFKFHQNDGSIYRHAINTGSVGKPKDGDPRACYAILNIDEGTSPMIKESVSVEFIRVDYEIEKAAAAVENSKLPAVYAKNLRTGL